ncbi:uncharacterized protein A4U43_UnF6270 [Asparagus officinalis]|uniref:Protein kinase domain-containing protein n=1 Tax=Asparagus officinalis TaxID=4686 RepID=A0A1R3L6H7_ASPOF|nr:uncharacterized protein A4U43_UnF6270 [Asparagus officinalis]
MPKGNLDQWLYYDAHYLSLLQRLNILVDISFALEYLHHHHPHTVLHCDLKPTNVLLDEEMTAHVSDFGIVKLLLVNKSVVSASTPGTIGYIAPGNGSFRLVYKGCLDDGLIVIVEVLDLEVEGASNFFESEYQALSKVRHRNLLKIITLWLKPDFKTLVLQFLPNGNLDQWLYTDGCHLGLL